MANGNTSPSRSGLKSGGSDNDALFLHTRSRRKDEYGY